MLKYGIEHYDHNRNVIDMHYSKLMNMVYIDAHSFSDPEQYALIRKLQLIRETKPEWVIVDLRSNSGGTISVLLALLYNLYPREVMQYVAYTERFNIRTGLTSALANYEDRIQELYVNATNRRLKRYLLKILNKILSAKQDFVNI